MTLDEAIERFEHNAEFERRNGNLQGCLEFRQLVEWLSALQEYKDVLEKIRAEIEQYQANCNLTNSDEIDRKFCDSITFDTIYRIIDCYREGANE